MRRVLGHKDISDESLEALAERRECMERETRDASACARRAWLDWRRERELLEPV